MFKRVIFEDWTTIIPIISFGVTLLVFVSFFIRTVLMDKETIERSARLALQKDDNSQPESSHE
jgi:hypothetical protein